MVRVDCPPLDKLQMLALDLPSCEGKEELRAHLDECEHCRSIMEQMSSPKTAETEISLASGRQLSFESSWENLVRSNDTSVPQIPGYEIKGMLGRGGMGVVYRAYCLWLKQDVALKMVDPGGDNHDAVLTRFRAETEAVARLSHPNIVRIYDVGTHEGRPYLSLELCEGGDLSEATEQGTIDPWKAARWIRDVARGIEATHERGVIHRDLKPSNILLSADGSPKVTDFGLAKLSDGVGMTRTGDVLGTPGYMAPEQARGQLQQIGPASDVYGLGAVLYHLVTGEPPFDHDDPVELMNQVCKLEANPPSRLNPAVPPEFDLICLTCLRKEAKQRYPSALEVADDLGRFLTGQPVLARPRSLIKRAWRWIKLHPMRIATALVGSLTLVVVLFILMSRVQNAEERAALAEDDLEVLSQDRLESLLREAHASLRAGISQHQIGESVRATAALEHARRQFEELGKPHLARVALLNQHTFQHQFPSLLRSLPLSQGVFTVVYSPEGDVIALGGRGLEVQLWDGKLQNMLASLAHDHPVHCLAFSPDGRFLLTGSGSENTASGEARLWDVDSRKPLGEPIRHLSPVHHVEFSPDGRSFLTVGASFARVWKTLEHPRNLAGLRQDAGSAVPARREPKAPVSPVGPPLKLAGTIHTAAFRPDGRAVLLGGGDETGEAQLFDIEDGTPEHRSPRPGTREAGEGEVRGGRQKTHLADARGPGKIGPRIEHPGPVRQVRFRPDGTAFATGCDQGMVRLTDAKTGEPLLEPWSHLGAVTALCFHPRGRLLAVGVETGTPSATSERRSLRPGTREAGEPKVRKGGGMIRCWDTQTGQALNEGWIHRRRINSLAFRDDGCVLVSGTQSGGVRFWATATGQLLSSPYFAQGSVTAILFHPKEARCVVTHDSEWGQSALSLWEVSTNAPDLLVTDHRRGITAVAVSVDGSQIATAGNGDGAQIWNLKDRTPTARIEGTGPTIISLEFGDAGRVLSVDRHAIGSLWEINGSNTVRRPLQTTHGVELARLTPDGQRAIMVSVDQADLRHLEKAGIEASFRHSEAIRAVTFDPRGRWLVIGSDTSLVLWDLLRQKRVWQKTTTAKVTALAISPDQRQLLVGFHDGTSLLLSTKDSSEAIADRFQHPTPITAVGFHPEGQVFLTAGAEGMVRLWSAESGSLLGPPLLHSGSLSTARFLPDGQTVLCACDDQILRFWNIADRLP